MNAQPELTEWAEQSAILEAVEKNAGREFQDAAQAFVLRYLATHGQASGEELTDAAKAAGIHSPTTDKAFGTAYRNLSKGKLIERAGFTFRRKGHCCPGATLWRLTTPQPE